MSEQLTLDGAAVRSDAVMSPCKRYRYQLTRTWDDAGPMIEFVMLNPSTADAHSDDPTIRRCMAFAKRWGYGRVVVRNLFALRATNPQALLAVSGGLLEALGPWNANYLERTSADCTIAAWGAHAAALEWFAAGHRIVRPRLYCLGTNDGGSPKHPLYVPSSRTPIPWEAS